MLKSECTESQKQTSFCVVNVFPMHLAAEVMLYLFKTMILVHVVNHKIKLVYILAFVGLVQVIRNAMMSTTKPAIQFEVPIMSQIISGFFERLQNR